MQRFKTSKEQVSLKPFDPFLNPHATPPPNLTSHRSSKYLTPPTSVHSEESKQSIWEEESWAIHNHPSDPYNEDNKPLGIPRLINANHRVNRPRGPREMPAQPTRRRPPTSAVPIACDTAIDTPTAIITPAPTAEYKRLTIRGPTARSTRLVAAIINWAYDIGEELRSQESSPYKGGNVTNDRYCA
ncbi:hypothetical protein NLJ89_g9869 [Agrocybe chaxingu]|uniref:Uncharacterized protein n=1 Tax=Agrocybe chaxingu TaxID=84603 RepID=A0A9W8JS84_9AGAR|nr:hypothetical protein NLJ89_g9869 [Agrocybe chaxingu]